MSPPAPSPRRHLCYREDDNRNGSFMDPGELKVKTKWAAGKLGDPQRMPLCSAAELAALPPAQQALADHPLADDVAFVSAMLSFLESSYSIDPKRVYASGFSNGSCMTLRLAVEMSDRFAAIGAAAGPQNVPAALTARPISVLFSVGNVDPTFTEPLGIPELPMTPTLPVDVPGFTAILRPTVVSLGLDPGFTYDEQMVAGQKVSKYTLASSNRGASNRLITVVLEGLAHQYPNGVNYPIVAADLLWTFFQPERLP